MHEPTASAPTYDSLFYYSLQFQIHPWKLMCVNDKCMKNHPCCGVFVYHCSQSPSYRARSLFQFGVKKVPFWPCPSRLGCGGQGRCFYFFPSPGGTPTHITRASGPGPGPLPAWPGDVDFWAPGGWVFIWGFPKNDSRDLDFPVITCPIVKQPQLRCTAGSALAVLHFKNTDHKLNTFI